MLDDSSELSNGESTPAEMNEGAVAVGSEVVSSTSSEGPLENEEPIPVRVNEMEEPPAYEDVRMQVRVTRSGAHPYWIPVSRRRARHISSGEFLLDLFIGEAS